MCPPTAVSNIPRTIQNIHFVLCNSTALSNKKSTVLNGAFLLTTVPQHAIVSGARVVLWVRLVYEIVYRALI